MLAGMKFAVGALAVLGLAWATILALVAICWRSPWALVIVIYGVAFGLFVGFCGLVGAALGF